MIDHKYEFMEEKMESKKRLVMCLAAAVYTGLCIATVIPSFAVSMEEIIVTASRLEEELKYSPDSVTVVTEKQMEQKGQKTVIEVLREVPGIVIPQNGSFGGTSSIFIRGTSNAHTLVMIDGVRVDDPITADGKVSLSSLSTDNIERIEIVRGAQSVLYGSDAIGGVINIITKKGKGKPTFIISSEAGSFESFREKVGVSGSNDRLSYSASAERFDTKAVSKADKKLSGVKEDDYYNTTSLSTRLIGNLSETVKAGVSARYTKSKMDYDNTGSDADKVQDTTITTIAANYDQTLFNWWEHVIKLGSTNVQRDYTKNDGQFDGSYNGSSRLASWQHNFFIGKIDTISAGFDYEEGDGDNQGTSSNIRKKYTSTKGFFIQNKLTPVTDLSLTLGYRVIDHQSFGGKDTYKGAVAYFFEKTGTKIRGSYGTGFRSPSLYQLYSSYGDATLKPETSKGYDVGVDQYFFAEKVHCFLTWFYNDLENMIAWDSATSKYKNVSAAKTQGWETGVSITPVKWLSFNINYTFTEAKDETPGGANKGKTLTYRPQHSGSSAINIKPMEELNININAQYVGERYRDYSNKDEMPAYKVFNLAASYDVTKWLQVFGRVENFTDENYQSIYQYGEPGIGFYGGVKLTF